MTIAHTARPTELVNSVKLQAERCQFFTKQNKRLRIFLSLIHILDNKNKLFFFICIQVFTRENNFLGGGPPYNLHMFLKFKVTLVNVTREKKVHISTKK